MQEQTRQKTVFSTGDIVVTGVYAAIIFLGTQVFRFSLGPAFVHFGNIFLMLAALLLGPKKGVAAAVIGYAAFDILNGYASSLVKILPFSAVKALVPALLFPILKRKMKEPFAVGVSVAAGFATYPLLDIIWRTAEGLFQNIDSAAAFYGALGAQISPLVNMAVGILVVPILYPIFKRAMQLAHIPIYKE